MLPTGRSRLKWTARILFVIILVGLFVPYFYFRSDEYWQQKNYDDALIFHKKSTFQPRASTNYLLDYISNTLLSEKEEIRGGHRGIHFHWDDWIDLSPGDSMLNDYRETFPEGECDSSLEQFGNVNPFWMELHHKKLLRSLVFSYCTLPVPSQIFLMGDDNLIKVPVSSKKRFSIGNTPYSKEELVNKMLKIESSLDKKKESLIEIIPFEEFPKTIEVNTEEFAFNPDYEILKLKSKLNKDNPSKDDEEKFQMNDMEYLDFLEYANLYVDTAPKYFKYPWIYSDLFKGQAHHLEFKFFRRYIGDHERQSVVHHMSRAWFEFAQANNIVLWINYGSLLGWVYNGVNMPWDTDVDIQVPINELAKLTRRGLNNSLVIENPRFGNAKYLFDISPLFIRQGNSNNFIDARFIEVNSGLYIDILALSKTIYPPPSEIFEGLTELEVKLAIPVNCKNFNWQLIEEILPIKYATFEGGPSFIPNQVSRILDRKYGRESYTTKEEFKGHNYQSDLNMWVPDRICKFPHLTDSRFVLGDKSRLTLEGACDSIELQDEYQIVYESSQRHIALEDEQDTPVTYDIGKLGSLPILRKDPWDYFHDINKDLVKHDRWFVKVEGKEKKA